MAAERPSTRRRKIPGDAKDVSRAEFENIETALRGNGERLARVEARLETLSRDIAELTRVISTLRPKS
jgi:hypothetical protein